MNSTGSEGCQCADVASILETITARHCTLPNGDVGIYVTPGKSCAPLSYGSNACLTHDLYYDDNCRADAADSALGTTISEYCNEKWCYVDLDECKRDSNKEIFHSEYFPEAPLFWSYTTCGTDADVATMFSEENIDVSIVLGNVSLTAAIPSYQLPMLYKRDLRGGIIFPPGHEYYDDTIPVEGVYINYIKELIRVSGGDMSSISYTHTSRASSEKHPTSSFTAAVQDVENGLVDIAVGPFWVTAERLKMAAFTIPFTYDRTVLVIPKPGASNSLSHEIAKVGMPFEWGFWLLIIAVIIFTALLSVWFSERDKIAKTRYGTSTRKKNKKYKKTILFRLFIDELIQKGLFFFSAGVDQDRGASLPAKILMFGFGFFILVSVSAYVANLAAFLTQAAASSDIKTIDQVRGTDKLVCAHAALEEELRLKWDRIKWDFGARNFNELLGRKGCVFYAVGREDTTMDLAFQKQMCDLNLVYTDSVISENPMAFPIKPELAPGFSHWMYLGGKYYDVSIPSAKEAYETLHGSDSKCNPELEAQEESDEYTQITVQNMTLPLLIFLVSVIVAAVLQIIHDFQQKKGVGRGIMVGRLSSLVPNSARSLKDARTAAQMSQISIGATESKEPAQPEGILPELESNIFVENVDSDLEDGDDHLESGRFESKLRSKIKHVLDETIAECFQDLENLKKQE